MGDTFISILMVILKANRIFNNDRKVSALLILQWTFHDNLSACYFDDQRSYTIYIKPSSRVKPVLTKLVKINLLLEIG